MYINTLLKQKNMTKYKLSKKSGVPHTTVIDICNGKTMLNKCNAETVYKLAKALDVTMEELVAEYVEKRPSFENFKSTVCHMVNDMGDIDFMLRILESNEIRKLYDKHWYVESLYLLGMIDYLSKENNISYCEEYNDLRSAKMQSIVYPLGVMTRCILSNSDQPKVDCLQDAIPEFLRHNIVESEIRNVC